MKSNKSKSKSRSDLAQPVVANQQPMSRKRRGRDNGMTVTLATVGNLVGVSPSTVSRVVSNSTPVSPELREAVESAIAQLGYVPNRAARNLATSRSDSIGVVISESMDQLVNDPFIVQLLFGITAGLSETEFQLVLIMASNERDKERVQRYLQKGHVDGVILIGSHRGDPLIEQVAKRKIPLVFSGRPPVAVEVDYVDVDHRAGAKMAVSHLIAGGRRKIATIYGTLDMPSSCDKLEGYRDAILAAGLELDPTLEEAGNYNPILAGEAMRTLLDRHPDLDAVFVASDTMAAAVVGVLVEAEFEIPEDIAMVGYDGTPLAMATRPKLTTVRQPIEAMGRKLAELLLKRIEQPDEPATHTIFATELVIQESSGTPASPLAGSDRPILPSDSY
jgi:DNA-binding LacI/PurR family transcriptional regulator